MNRSFGEKNRMIELRENEQKTLRALQNLNGKAGIGQITETSSLAHAAVMRAALTLAEKQLVTIHEQEKNIIELSEEGKLYAQKDLPERCLINALIELGREAPVENVIEKAQLDKKFLSLLEEKGSLTVEELDKEMREAVPILKGRKLLGVTEKAVRELELTAAGWQLVKKGLEIVSEVSQLTPELIITGKWRETKLRKFDVTIAGPEFYPAKIHPLQQVIKRAREIFLEMGFTEIRGPLVETAFWNFDALFQPQDHPAREMMDT